MDKTRNRICDEALHFPLSHFKLFSNIEDLVHLIWDIILFVMVFCSSRYGIIGIMISFCLYVLAIIIVEDVITPQKHKESNKDGKTTDVILCFSKERVISKPQYSQMFRFSTSDSGFLILPQISETGYVAAKRIKHENLFFSVFCCVLSIALFFFTSISGIPVLFLLILFIVFIPLKHFLIFMVPRKWFVVTAQ